MMRVPPPGDLSSDQALAFLRERLTEPDGGRLGRYAAAMGSGANLAAVVAVADSELAELRALTVEGPYPGSVAADSDRTRQVARFLGDRIRQVRDQRTVLRHEVASLEARIAAAVALHQPTAAVVAPWCRVDALDWPCPTIQALTEEPRP